MSESMGTKMLLLWHWALADQWNSLSENIWSAPHGLILHLAVSWHSQGSKNQGHLQGSHGQMPSMNSCNKTINKNIPNWKPPAASSPRLQTVTCAKEWQLHLRANFFQRTLIHYFSSNSLLPWWLKFWMIFRWTAMLSKGACAFWDFWKQVWLSTWIQHAWDCPAHCTEYKYKVWLC